MKNLKSFLAAAFIATTAFTASAQRGFDTFGPQALLTLYTPNQIVGAITVSNTPCDTRMLEGIATLTVQAYTNGASAFTVRLRSAALTNGPWADVSNVAVGVPATILYTNAFGALTYATNNWVLPGTVTTPTAATSGFASTYLNASPFTNSGAIQVPAGGVLQLAFSVDDASRYLQVVIAQAGAFTNFVGATLSAHPRGNVFINNP